MGRKRGRERKVGPRRTEGRGSKLATLQTVLEAPSHSAKWMIRSSETVAKKREGCEVLQGLRVELEGVWVSVAGRRDRVSAGRRPL